MKKLKISRLTPDSRYLQTVALKRLPLSPDILPKAVRQRTGGNDVLPLVNHLSIKLIDQNDIRFPFIKDKNINMTVAEEKSFECPFVFDFALLWKRLNFFSTEIR